MNFKEHNDRRRNQKIFPSNPRIHLPIFKGNAPMDVDSIQSFEYHIDKIQRKLPLPDYDVKCDTVIMPYPNKHSMEDIERINMSDSIIPSKLSAVKFNSGSLMTCDDVSQSVISEKQFHKKGIGRVCLPKTWITFEEHMWNFKRYHMTAQQGHALLEQSMAKEMSFNQMQNVDPLIEKTLLPAGGDKRSIVVYSEKLPVSPEYAYKGYNFSKEKHNKDIPTAEINNATSYSQNGSQKALSSHEDNRKTSDIISQSTLDSVSSKFLGGKLTNIQELESLDNAIEEALEKYEEEKVSTETVTKDVFVQTDVGGLLNFLDMCNCEGQTDDCINTLLKQKRSICGSDLESPIKEKKLKTLDKKNTFDGIILKESGNELKEIISENVKEQEVPDVSKSFEKTIGHKDTQEVPGEMLDETVGLESINENALANKHLKPISTHIEDNKGDEKEELEHTGHPPIDKSQVSDTDGHVNIPDSLTNKLSHSKNSKDDPMISGGISRSGSLIDMLSADTELTECCATKQIHGPSPVFLSIPLKNSEDGDLCSKMLDPEAEHIHVWKKADRQVPDLKDDMALKEESTRIVSMYNVCKPFNASTIHGEDVENGSNPQARAKQQFFTPDREEDYKSRDSDVWSNVFQWKTMFGSDIAQVGEYKENIQVPYCQNYELSGQRRARRIGLSKRANPKSLHKRNKKSPA